MNKYQIKRYYIDEEVLLMKAIGGDKKTKSGGVVVMSQRAMTCRTCFAVIGENHFDSHTNTHVQKPVRVK